MPRRRPSRSAPAAPRRGAPLLPWLLLAVAAAWMAGAGSELLRSSHWAHYVYLADAWLHGQLHLARTPNDAGDMAVVDGRLYVVFGPFPAVLLLPLVPVFKRATPDVLVLALTALAGVAAFHRAAARLWGEGDRLRLACLTLTFALGTALHYGAPMGNVWLHAQITATTLQCFALWAAAAGRPWTAGVLLGLTVLTRATTTLALPFAAWLLLRPAGDGARRPWARVALALVAPVAAGAALHALYNWARFGNPLDAGYHYILMGEAFERRVAEHGRFSLHFLPGNLWGWLARPPLLERGALVPDPHGMSLFLTTPFLALAAWPRRWTALEAWAAASALLCFAPSLFYYNDGWVHFGQRFALDGIAPALLAAHGGARRAPPWLVVALTVWGVAVGAWGLQWFRASFLH